MNCQNCAVLARQIDLLRRVLAETIGGIRATTRFIEEQHDEPTMPRRDLPTAIHNRLTFITDTAEGRNR